MSAARGFDPAVPAGWFRESDRQALATALAAASTRFDEIAAECVGEVVDHVFPKPAAAIRRARVKSAWRAGLVLPPPVVPVPVVPATSGTSAADHGKAARWRRDAADDHA